jgi:hypothetical protein
VSYDEERDCKVCDSGHRVDSFGNIDGPWSFILYVTPTPKKKHGKTNAMLFFYANKRRAK